MKILFNLFVFVSILLLTCASVETNKTTSDHFFDSFPPVTLDSLNMDTFNVEGLILVDSIEFGSKLNAFKPFQRPYDRYTPVRKFGSLDLNPNMKSLLVTESNEYWGYSLFLLNYDLNGNPQNYSLLASCGGDAGYFECSTLSLKEGELTIDYVSELPFDDYRGQIHLVKKDRYIFNDDLSLQQIGSFSKADTTMD